MKERAKERLPEFTQYEKDFVKGTSDYFCINTYSSQLVQNDSQPPTSNSTTPRTPSKDDEEGVVVFPNQIYLVRLGYFFFI